MSTVPATVWDDIITHVRVSHPALVRGWFSDLALAEVESGVVEIRAGNGAQVRYLQQHCRAAFTEAAQAATGQLVSVQFEADDEADPHAAGTPYPEHDEQLALNPDYTFENFVTGPCNRLAHAAAISIAEEPGRAYNPFFIYGAVGLGKTHLLQAICLAIRDRHAHGHCHYISCETFINNFIEAVEYGLLNQFRYRYRRFDILVIDDIQFLAERERSQEEFFHTFNTLYQSHRQIILSADCSPGEIPCLEERLVSRFNSGLVAMIDQPSLETRIAIIQKKAKLRCIEVPDDVVRLMASQINTNTRDLEGALTKLDALSQTQSGRITIDLAREALGPARAQQVRIPTILETVAGRFNLRVSDLQSRKRSKAVTYPRQVCMYLARQLTSQSLEGIGGYFGGRDHTTVLHASRTIAQQAQNDPELRELLDDITSDVKNASD